MEIRTKRVYEAATAGDGTRILIDRLWPRGLSKERARLDFWARDAAPSHALRRWYAHEPAKWDEFRTRYFRELDAAGGAVEPVVAASRHGRITLLFSSRERDRNNAHAFREYLQARAGAKRAPADFATDDTFRDDAFRSAKTTARTKTPGLRRRVRDNIATRKPEVHSMAARKKRSTRRNQSWLTKQMVRLEKQVSPGVRRTLRDLRKQLEDMETQIEKQVDSLREEGEKRRKRLEREAERLFKRIESSLPSLGRKKAPRKKMTRRKAARSRKKAGTRRKKTSRKKAGTRRKKTSRKKAGTRRKKTARKKAGTRRKKTARKKAGARRKKTSRKKAGTRRKKTARKRTARRR